MRSAVVDVMWGFSPDETPRSMPLTGGIAWRDPGYAPSPRLLWLGQQARAAGHDVTVHCLTEREALEQPAALRERLDGCERVLLCAPAPHQEAAGRVLQLLREGPGGADRTVEIIDPFAHAAGGWTDPPYGYELAGGLSAGQAEVDVFPRTAAVHPWVVPSVPSAPVEQWQARLSEAARSLAGAPEVRLYLNDDRLTTDMDRLRFVAQTVSASIRDHGTLPELHLRAWPADLIADDRLLDHLTLLPLGSLEVLAGSFSARALEARGRAGSLEVVEQAVARVHDSGLSHLAGLSLALALPGETAEEAMDGLTRALKAAARAGIRRVRLALWLGDGPLPRDRAGQDQAFLASHPDWHPLEYRGLFDLAAIMARAMPQMTLLGPGLLPGWEPPALDEDLEQSAEPDGNQA